MLRFPWVKDTIGGRRLAPAARAIALDLADAYTL
jgi:hypothetical protein